MKSQIIEIEMIETTASVSSISFNFSKNKKPDDLLGSSAKELVRGVSWECGPVVRLK